MRSSYFVASQRELEKCLKVCLIAVSGCVLLLSCIVFNQTDRMRHFAFAPTNKIPQSPPPSHVLPWRISYPHYCSTCVKLEFVPFFFYFLSFFVFLVCYFAAWNSSCKIQQAQIRMQNVIRRRYTERRKWKRPNWNGNRKWHWENLDQITKWTIDGFAHANTHNNRQNHNHTHTHANYKVRKIISSAMQADLYLFQGF